jgi:ABC-type phosphate transport system substrate-binding protein
MRRRMHIGLAALAALAAAGVAALEPGHAQTRVEPIVLVVHVSRGSQALSVTDLKNIYLGRKKTWSDGTAIQPYMRPPRGGAGFTFHRNILKMTPARYRYHWQGLQLSGQGRQPRTLTLPADVLQSVAASPGAIGYVTELEAQKFPRPPQIRILAIKK